MLYNKYTILVNEENITMLRGSASKPLGNLLHLSSKLATTIGTATVAGVGSSKSVFSLFFAEEKPKFNLQEKIPQTKDAQDVYRQYPGTTFIGVFNLETKEITLMPAMPGYLQVNFNEKGEIVSATRYSDDKELNKEEVKVLNNDYKCYIPRVRKDKKTGRLVSHEIVLLNMGVLDKRKDYYGFSVIPRGEGRAPEICWLSGMLNSKSNGGYTREMPEDAQKEVEKILVSWSKPKNEPEVSSAPPLSRL